MLILVVLLKTLLGGTSKIWAGVSDGSVIELAKKTDISSYTHPSTQQCVIPDASATNSGLMTPTMYNRLYSLSYNYEIAVENASGTSSWNGSVGSYTTENVTVLALSNYTLSSYSLVRIDYSLTDLRVTYESDYVTYNGITIAGIRLPDTNVETNVSTTLHGKLFIKPSDKTYSYESEDGPFIKTYTGELNAILTSFKNRRIGSQYCYFNCSSKFSVRYIV